MTIQIRVELVAIAVGIGCFVLIETFLDPLLLQIYR